MPFGFFLYSVATRVIGCFISLLLNFRVAKRKEDPSRRGERLARNLVARPEGDLIWIHSASVGESIVALEVIKKVKEVTPKDVNVLHTSQTVTSASIIDRLKLPDTIHQMAPIDIPNIARRFIRHWHPTLLVLVEGEIWPNLLLEARKSGSHSILINGRMTAKSLRGWKPWKSLAKEIFGGFDEVICADDITARGLEELSGKSVHCINNLKSSLPPLEIDGETLENLNQTFKGHRKCLVASSTHPGEEKLVLEIYQSLSPRPALVIAPRHPERGQKIAKLSEDLGFNTLQYSIEKEPNQETEVLVADTLGDLGLWYRLADAIFLGGAFQQGIGGHNPFEPIRLNQSVITGPFGYNFSEDFKQLSKIGVVTIVNDKESLRNAVQTQFATSKLGYDENGLSKYLQQTERPIEFTVNLIKDLLQKN